MLKDVKINRQDWNFRFEKKIYQVLFDISKIILCLGYDYIFKWAIHLRQFTQIKKNQIF